MGAKQGTRPSPNPENSYRDKAGSDPHEFCCSKEMMVKFREALTKCVSEIDTIIGTDGSVSGGRLPPASQTKDAHNKSRRDVHQCMPRA